jgi:hypothetical protein
MHLQEDCQQQSNKISGYNQKKVATCLPEESGDLLTLFR